MTSTRQDWQRLPLREFITVKHGYAFKGEYFSEDPGEIVLTPGNFEPSGGLRLRSEKDRSYTGEFPDEFRLAPGDLLIVMTDLTQEARILGAAAFMPDGVTLLHNQRLGKIINRDPSLLNLRFLYFVFNDPKFRGAVKASATGSTVRHTSPGRILDYQLLLPPLSLQSRIASILGAYDDLIEVNRRRIAVLEEMARRLFDEWFVQLGFPGSDMIGQCGAEHGLLPKGWKSLPFTSVAEVLSGGTPKKSHERYWGGNIPFFTPRDAPDTSWVFETAATVTESGVQNCNSQLDPAKTVFITARGTVGKLALAGVPMAMNQSCYALQGRAYPQYFLLEFSRNAVSELKGMSSGAVFDTIIVDTFARLQRRVPPLDLALHFERMVEPVFSQAGNLICANSKLAASRDHLLPRLMSGALSVTTAEQELADAA